MEDEAGPARPGMPSRERALALLAREGAGGAILRHCLAVEKLAVRLALHAQDMGHALDEKLVSAAALLHDIQRKAGRDHAGKGAALLKQLGYPEVAAVVGAHMDLPPEAVSMLDERALVYLADKLVLEDKRVGLGERFAGAAAKFARDEQASAAVRRRLEDAKAILAGLGLTERDCLDM